MEDVTIDQLREMDDDGIFLNRIIDAYLEKSPVDLEHLNQGIKELNGDALRIASHSFKSSSYNLGAHQLAELCKTLEAMARDNDLDKAKIQYCAISVEYQRAKEALIKIQDNNHAGKSDE